jgi:hypothetical protein
MSAQFGKFIDGVIAFKKLAYSHKLKFKKLETNTPTKGITPPENANHADFANSQLDSSDSVNNDRKKTDFLPYGKAAPPDNDQNITDFLKTKGHDNGEYAKLRSSRIGQKDHLLSILNNTHYFFGSRVDKEKQAKVNLKTTGLSEDHANEINSIDHGLNETQLHALLYLDSHDILKDAPPVVSDRYQQSRYFDLMRQEIANKQAGSEKPLLDKDGKPLLDKNGKPRLSPKWEVTKSSLSGIHERVRKSILPEMSGGDRFGSDTKSESGKLTVAQTVDMFPSVVRGMIKGAASFVGLAKNTKPDDTMMPLQPAGKNGEFTNEQLHMLDQDFSNKGGYSPTDNANFTRMWHAVMHQEVWDLIDGTTIGKDHSSSEKMALYHEFGGRGVIERLAEAKLVEARKKGPAGDKEQAVIEDERMRALVALGLTFATDHVAQALFSEGQGKTSGNNNKGFLILPNGEWKEYKDAGEKNKLIKEHNATQDSGALWYDDDMAQTDSNIIRMLNFVNKDNNEWKKIKELNDTVPPTDVSGNEQNIYLTCFKALMAPTSFGMQPGANLGVATKMYLQALKEKKADKNGQNRSVFSYINTKQDESSDPDGVLHLQHENRLYGRAKAVSNSMEILDPELYKNINFLYASEDKENIRKAIHLQKEWLRLEYRDILIQKDEDAKLRPPKKNNKDDDESEEKAELKSVNIKANNIFTNTIEKIRLAALDPNFVIPSGKESQEDDLDMTVKGALKKPSLSALTRNHKRGDDQTMINTWADKAATGSETNTWSDKQKEQLKKDLKNMQFSSDDLQKDWTTRGGSINPMLRFIKNYSLAFGKDGDHQLSSFLQGSHSAAFMAQEWAKYSLATDENGKNSFQVDMEEARSIKNPFNRAKAIEDVKDDYVRFIKKTEAKFIKAAPAGLRDQIKEGKLGVSGSYIFGPKGGNFHQDLSYNGGYPTKDLWFTRWMLWGLGTMTNKSGKLIDTPPTQLAGVFDLINNFTANEFKLTNKQVQAVGWYHWKNFCTRMGVKTAGMENYTSASKKHYDAMVTGAGEDPEPMPEIPKDKANAYAKKNPNGPPSNRAGVPKNFSAANLARAYAVLGKSNSDLTRKPFTMDNPSNRTRQQAKGKGKTRLPGRGRGVVKFAQFKPAPGGMTGAPVATRTNQPFSNAVAKSPGGKNLAQGALGNQINAKGGVNTTAQNAVGDWPNGSEESIIHTAPQGTDPFKLKYLGAWHGISGQKKSVLVFHPNPKGPDSLYHMVHPSTDMGEVREQLIAAGINYKTLLPGKTNTRVVVYDPNRGMRNTVDQFATLNNLNVEENIGQGEIVGHNGDWNSAGALPKSRQAYQNIIGEYEQNSNQAGPTNNPSGASTNGTSPSAGKAQQLSRKTTTKAKIKFDRSRRILEGFLRQHNTPNRELPPVGDLLSQDLQNIKPEHLSKYQQLIPDAKWSDIEGAVTSLQQDPSLYDDMTSESNRKEMYCKEHARTVLQSSGLKKLIDSLQVQKMIPEHAQHLIEDAKDGDYFSLEAISSELKHGVPSLRAFAKAAEKEYNKAGKVWDKMRTQPQPQKFAKSEHAKDQYRAGKHGVTFRGRNYNGGQFAPKDDGVKRFEKDSNLTHMIRKLRGA